MNANNKTNQIILFVDEAVKDKVGWWEHEGRVI